MRILFFIFILINNSSFSKSGFIDSLLVYDSKLSAAPNYQARYHISTKINKLVSACIDNGSYEQIDSLKYITLLTSVDKKVTILSWEIPNDSDSFVYFCSFIIKNKNQYKLTNLVDKSVEMKSAEYATSNSNKWYGAHYYQLIENKFNKQVYYTLIGIDWKSILSKKKVIESFKLDATGNLLLGEPIFQVGKQTKRRFILEYKYDITISCRYNQDIDMIVFDHLIPPNSSLKNQKQFYVNDLSFDALKFTKGKWIYLEDVDVRNGKSPEDSNYNSPK